MFNKNQWVSEQKYKILTTSEIALFRQRIIYHLELNFKVGQEFQELVYNI